MLFRFSLTINTQIGKEIRNLFSIPSKTACNNFKIDLRQLYIYKYVVVEMFSARARKAEKKTAKNSKSNK